MSNRKIDNLREPSNVHFKVQTGYPGALDAKEGTLTLRYISGTGLCLFAFHANKWNMIKLAPMNAKDETIVENLVVKNLEVDKTAKFKSSKIDVSDKNLPEIKKWNKSYDDLRSGEVDAKFKKAKVSSKLSSKEIDCSNNLTLGSEDSNVLIKNDSGVLKVRSADDTADAKVHAKYVQVTGEVDTEENTLAYSSSFGPVMRANGFAVEGYTIPVADNGYTQACATNSSSSTITCGSANTNIKVGHIPIGTGIPSGKLCYVGAITESGGAGTGVTSFTLHQDGSAVNATATNDPVTLTFQSAKSTQLRILSHDHHSTLAFTTTGTANPWTIGVDIREATHSDNPNDAPFVISKGTTDDLIHSQKKVIIDATGNVTLTENLSLTSTSGETTTMSVADTTGVFTIATAGDGTTDSNLILDIDGDISMDAAGGDVNITSANLYIDEEEKLYLNGPAPANTYFRTNQTSPLGGSTTDNLDIYVGENQSITTLHNSTVNEWRFHSSCATFRMNDATYNATTTTVDFRNTNKMNVVFGAGNITNLAMYFPYGSGNFTLLLKQDGTGSRTITNYKIYDAHGGAAAGSSALKWAGGSAPTLTTAANHIDIVSIFYDGNSETAYAAIVLDFQD
tara:strand:- start:156 stop:2024 length:1869 start_codon:yes stop_codon:yes gene_type:complete